MIKKKFVMFLILSLCLYFVLLGIIGKNGYLYNQSLKKQLEILQNEAYELGIDINLLVEEKSFLLTEEGLRDAAINLGYYVEGDTIHVFDEVSVQKSKTNNSAEHQLEFFNPANGALCALISIISSFVITCLSVVFTKKKENQDDFKQNRFQDNPDDYFINA